MQVKPTMEKEKQDALADAIRPVPTLVIETNGRTFYAAPGDVILYLGNRFVIYYDENTRDFTRLGKIEGATREGLLSVFGEGSVTVKLWAEWSE